MQESFVFLCPFLFCFKTRNIQLMKTNYFLKLNLVERTSIEESVFHIFLNLNLVSHFHFSFLRILQIKKAFEKMADL